MRYVIKVKVLVVLVILAIGVGLTIDSAQGFIAMKKVKVINSPEVCGDRLCDEKEQTIPHQTKKNKQTPLGQFKLGIPIDKITCKPGLEYVIKSSNWHPACVKPENAEKLQRLGWAVQSSELNNVFAAIAQKQTSQFKPLVEYEKVYPRTTGVGIDIQPDVVNGKLYLNFDGYGWHGFHNVEITISNDNGVSEFVMSQTSDEGDLYLPWEVPDTITAGLYNIYATDGINEYEINMPIASP